VLEEKVVVVGMPLLKEHDSLEDAMHLYQLKGFKFLSKSLVKEDFGRSFARTIVPPLLHPS
jgi:hypothetical protein